MYRIWRVDLWRRERRSCAQLRLIWRISLLDICRCCDWLRKGWQRGVENAGAFTYITRISEPSFNRFPIRGNIIFGPTPSFVLRPSLLLVMLQQTDFSISSVAFKGFATRRKILYFNYLIMILVLYFDLVLFYCIFCVHMGFFDGFNLETGSLGWLELIVSIFTYRKPFMDVIHDHGRKIVSTVERITIEPESWTINVQSWSLTMTQ